LVNEPIVAEVLYLYFMQGVKSFFVKKIASMKIHLILLTLFLTTACSTTKNSKASTDIEVPEYVINIKGLFTFQKSDNWYEHYFHNNLNYSPNGFEQGSKFAKNNIFNYITVNVFDNELSLHDYIKITNQKKVNSYQELKIDVEKKQTSNGLCYIEKSTSSWNHKKLKGLKYYYKHSDKIYIINYSAEVKYYDTYLNEAEGMMDSFEIIKE